MTAINLLPWREQRRERQRRAFVAGLGASFAAAAAAIMIAALVVGARVDKARENNAGLAAQVVELDDRLAIADDLRRRNADIEARIDTLRRVHAARHDAVRVFDELARALVPGLRYTAVARRDGVVSVQGSADAESSVSAFMRNVGRSAWFSPPSLQNIADADGAQAVFDLTFTVLDIARREAEPDEESSDAH